MSTNDGIVEALRSALREREELRRDNERLLAALHEPIAVVSAGCRYPGGARSPEQLWDLVVAGRDVTGELPADRGWQPDALARYRGGFLHDAAEFDADFFGISPREALAMDPQQRLLLQTCWEVLERAGIVPETLAGSPTGVWLGALVRSGTGIDGLPEDIQVHLLTGATQSVVSGRVAYCFGLRGPAISVDTACSTSLVAIHQACQALRAGDCTLAFAGGAAVLDTPLVFRTFERQGGLASDGRCKAFAASADGVGWAEGVGVVLLERLSDARRNGHPVLAVIRGSAVNSDGASNGLTAPNGPAQRAVIRQALAAAGLSPADVDVVEAHGTGTPLGDPIEAQAILATYGQDRDRPLWLGSVKSNIGHTQAAAGVAGVIKMVEALAHRVLPATLHAAEPTSAVDWSSGQVRLLTEQVPWTPADGRPRRAGVSSFGFSGTNAHLILEEVEPVAADEPGEPPPVVPWVLSARTAAALREQASRLPAAATAAEHQEVGRALATGRSSFPHRAVVLGADRGELLTGLAALGAGAPAPNVLSGVAGDAGKVAFVFGGQGAQWPGMGRELLDSSAVFADALGECDRALSSYVDWSVLDVLRGLPDAPSLDRVDVVQPVLFAIMVSLARLWRSAGVRPAAVVGHSQGEIAAACVAGILSLDDAARLVASRSQILVELAGSGAMASVAAGVPAVADRLSCWDGQVSVAAVNGPGSVVVSGAVTAVTELLAEFEADGTRVRRLPVDYASHSPAVERVRAALLAAAAGVTPMAGEVAFVSATDVATVDGTTLDARYWYRNLRETVRFEEAIRLLVADGVTSFVEVSPHPVLVSAISETLDAADRTGAVVGSIHRDDGGLRRFLHSMAQAHVAGVPVDWSALLPGTSPGVRLPTYPFQGERFWLDQSEPVTADLAAAGLASADHPLLGAAVDLPDGDGMLFSGRVSLAAQPWLADHTVFGVVVVPGTGLVELAAQAGESVDAPVVEELTLEAPLAVPQHGGVALRVQVGRADDDGRRAVTVHSRTEEHGGPWTRHATGTLATTHDVEVAGLTDWPPPGARQLPGGYDLINSGGYWYGPVFQGMRTAWRRGDTVFAEIVLPESAPTGGFLVHPALLDAVLHPLGLEPRQDGDGQVLLPFSWSGVRFHASGATALRARITSAGHGSVAIDLADEQGRAVASIASLATRPATAAELAATASASRDALFQMHWQPAPTGTTVPWVVFDDEADEAIAAGRTAVLPVPADGPPESVAELVCSVLGVLQAWLAADQYAGSRLVVVTRHADSALAAAAVGGLVRSAMSEHPSRFGLVDVDEPGDTAIETGLSAGVPECAVRNGQAFVPRLARLERAATGDRAGTWGHGTVLVTGGLSGIGAVVAKHLAASAGVAGIALVGRRGMRTPGADRLVAELTAHGVEVSVHACDVTDLAALGAVLAAVPEDRPLTGVVHAVGVLADATVESMTPQQVHTVVAPKVVGAWHLHELTRELDLSAFVLFSSTAASLGSPGQGNYAAANAALECLARVRRASGQAGVAVGWGLWDLATGMTAELTDAERNRLLRNGFLPLGTEDGLGLLDAAMAHGGENGALVATRLNLAALREQAQDGVLPPVLSSIVRVPARSADDDMAAAAIRERLAGLTTGERHEVVTELVRAVAAAVLGHTDVAAVAPDRAFSELGFDSLIAVEFRNRLAVRTGLRLPATLVFDQPNPQALSAFLCGQFETRHPVLDDLDNLEKFLSGTPQTELTTTVVDRVRAMLTRHDQPEPDTGGSNGDDLRTITDEELFGVLHEELRGYAAGQPGPDERNGR